MSCPYPNCAGESVVALPSCQSCTRPLLICSNCGAENRSLARSCRKCGKRISARNPDISKSLKDNISPRRLGEVRGRNPSALSYGGYLWLISDHGELYQTSSGAKALFHCATFPEGGFTFPLNLEIDDQSGPVIYTNNHHSVLRYNVLSAKIEKLFEDGNSRIVSGVIKRGKNFYYLTQESVADSQAHFTLNTSNNKLSYPLGGSTLHDAWSSPLQRIGDDLWVITREKVLVFRNFSAEPPKEFSWSPWHVWVTPKGILYSERVKKGITGDTQSIWRLTFGGKDFERYSLAQNLSLTARIATSQNGETVVITNSRIEVFDFAMNSIGELAGIVQVHNPQGILLSPPFIFWFETFDRSVRAWTIGDSRVHSLWSFKERRNNFSRFLLSGNSFYGFTEEEVWQWDLQGT